MIKLFNCTAQLNSTERYGENVLLYNLVKIAQVNRFLAHRYSISFDGAWLYLKGPQAVPDQGWKIHISVTSDHFVQTVAQIIPVLLANQCWYKVPITEHALMMLTSGAVDFLETGKIITIYCPNQSEKAISRIVHAFASVLPETDHVAIPTDIEFGHTNIYLRYGTYYPHYQTDDHGFRYSTLQTPKGNRFREVMAIQHERPNWVLHLAFIQHSRVESEDPLGQVALKDLGIQQPKVVRRDAKDSVFSIQYWGQPAFLKLAKANQLIFAGTNARNRLASEALILNKIVGIVRAPKVLLSLESNQQDLLVEQKAAGQSLRTVMNHLALTTQKMLGISQSLLHQLTLLHGLGIIYGDVSPDNVFVDNDEQVTLIDFDATSFVSDRQPLSGGTPGFFSYQNDAVLGRRTFADDTYAFGALLFDMVTSFLPLYSEAAEKGDLTDFYAKLRRVVSLTAATSVQYQLGMCGISLMADKGVSDDEIQHRLDQVAHKEYSAPERDTIVDDNKQSQVLSDAKQYIQNRIQHMDFRQKYELVGAGAFHRNTGYLSLNEGIIGTLLLILEYTRWSNDRCFLPDVLHILDWIKVAYPDPAVTHPGLANGSILLCRVISQYIALTGNRSDQSYSVTVSHAAIQHTYQDKQMVLSFSNGAIGVASVFLIGDCDDPEIQEFVQTTAKQCVELVSDSAKWAEFKRTSPDLYGLDRGISGIGIFLSLYHRRFSSVQVSAALAQLANELQPLFESIGLPASTLRIQDWKDLVAFFAVYGRVNPCYSNTANKLLTAIDRGHGYQYDNVRRGVAGLLLLAEMIGDQTLIGKYRQLLLVSASPRNDTLVWPLPNQVYLTNDYFLDGTTGIYWALLRSLCNSGVSKRRRDKYHSDPLLRND